MSRSPSKEVEHGTIDRRSCAGVVDSVPRFGQQALIGTYKLVSLAVEADGTGYQQMVKTPEGYLILTPTRLITVYVAENRKFIRHLCGREGCAPRLDGSLCRRVPCRG